ncbi:erythromycin esterase family protein [Kitasatospora sp. NPDC087861]|uniref:erythromycin esterase family protein n=1 Tax=Kitasatospora sp. NPDC087861 TaxID=3364070 RepID=UPI0037F9FD1D
MSQDIRDLVPASCALLALGEPTHQEPAFALIRNELFAHLVDRGFRSIAVETDRVAALTVNDFVQEGVGTLDTAMSEGFSHGFGELDANRRLVAWMREYNRNRPPQERLAFHGFDTQTENTSAPSPRRYLEHARDYLGVDLDLAGLAGEDQRWSRPEAVLDPETSPGATAEAEQLRVIADDLLTLLYARAPELVAATSRAEWLRARTHLTAGRGLLRYHRQSARRLEPGAARMSGLLGTRDVLMAQNLLDIRRDEARRGATVVFAHNVHLQRNPSAIRVADMDLTWNGAGAILHSLDEPYTFVPGSLGRSEAIGLQAPEPDTYEGALQRRAATWGLVEPGAVAGGRTRTDTTPEQGYFPLDRAVLDGADAILHIGDGAAAATS